MYDCSETQFFTVMPSRLGLRNDEWYWYSFLGLTLACIHSISCVRLFFYLVHSLFSILLLFAEVKDLSYCSRITNCHFFFAFMVSVLSLFFKSYGFENRSAMCKQMTNVLHVFLIAWRLTLARQKQIGRVVVKAFLF